MFDYLIQDATIVDGTGKKSYTGSVLIQKDVIAKIVTRGKPPKAKKTIPAKGLCLAPGFIDIHSHADWLLPDPGNAAVMEPLIRQGVTTVVTGQCGGTPAPLFGEYIGAFGWVQDALSDRRIPLGETGLEAFNARLTKNGIALNMAHFIGHGSMNLSLKGEAYKRPFTHDELKRLERAIDESFDAGAFGLSFGLGYPPGILSTLDEIKWFAAAAGRKGRMLSVHLKALAAVSPAYPFIPGGTPHNVIALREMFAVARHAGAPLQISHLIFVGRPSWNRADKLIRMIEKERDAGMDVAFDAFPYCAGNTVMVALIPSWFWNNFDLNIKSALKVGLLKLNYRAAVKIMGFDVYAETRLMKTNLDAYKKYEGKKFGEIAEDRGAPVFDTFLDLLERSRAMARVLIPGYYDSEKRDGLLAAVLAHPLCRFETDTLITRTGFQNPATFGTFTKILGTFSRDMGLFGLEDTVRKMTGASAERIGIKKRGSIAAGNYADLVLFDYGIINEHDDPNKPGPGIEYVFINGEPVLRKGVFNKKAQRGRVLRKNE